MNFQSILKHACNELEKAISDGHQINQSLAAFIICKTLSQEIPMLHYVYDGSLFSDSCLVPNLFVWNNDTHPALQFVGNLRLQAQCRSVQQDRVRALKGYVSASPVIDLAVQCVHQQSVKLRLWSVETEHYNL